MSEKETSQKSKEQLQNKKDVQNKSKKKYKEKMTAGSWFGVLVVILLAAWVVSMPLKKYLTVNGTYITVDGEKITPVEYDFNYYQARSTYLSQYGAMIQAYAGIDISKDFSKEMYSDTMTWGDFFDEMAVKSIKQNKGLVKAAKNAGFSYDTTEEYNKLMTTIEESATKSGVDVAKYVQGYYGPYATIERIEPYLREAMVASAYYKQVTEEKAPDDAAINAYYEENKNEYDKVDYRVKMVDAVLPTEPTELADEGAVVPEDGSEYQPSQAEIDKAMEEAKKEADEALPKITTEGDLQTDMTYYNVAYAIRDWLFDDSRKAGDKTVIESESDNRCYVLSFVKRFRDESASADLRVIMVQDGTADSIYEEWKNGEATEESFAALSDKYTVDTSAEGGLYEKLNKSAMQNDELIDWVYDSKRKKGDTTVIEVEEDLTYIIYYIGQNDPEWKNSIYSELSTETMTAYLEEIGETVTVEDPHNNLKYIKIREKEEADAAASEAAEAAAAEAESAEEAADAADTEATDAADTEAAAESDAE